MATESAKEMGKVSNGRGAQPVEKGITWWQRGRMEKEKGSLSDVDFQISRSLSAFSKLWLREVVSTRLEFQGGNS